MRWLELRVPPRLIALAVGLGMWAMSFLEPRFDLPQSHHWATALGGAVAGAAITFTGAATLRAAKTVASHAARKDHVACYHGNLQMDP